MKFHARRIVTLAVKSPPQSKAGIYTSERAVHLYTRRVCIHSQIQQLSAKPACSAPQPTGDKRLQGQARTFLSSGSRISTVVWIY